MVRHMPTNQHVEANLEKAKSSELHSQKMNGLEPRREVTQHSFEPADVVLKRYH
jgi:hypothetical protein